MKTLLDALDCEDSDLWYDDRCNYARSLIDIESPYIFTKLLKCWREFSEIQQEHLAYILDAGSTSLEDALIKDMTSSPLKQISFRAWEAHNNQSGEQGSAHQPTTR